MKTKEELNAIKKECEALIGKFDELSDDELGEVTGGTVKRITDHGFDVELRREIVSAKPGEGFKVNIRGIGTVGDSSPLYVVDGVPFLDNLPD